MPTPANRAKVQLVRGSYANISASIADLVDGELCYAKDQNKLYMVEGTTLTPIEVDTEQVEDAIAAIIAGGTGLTATHDDLANTLTIDLDDTGVTAGSYGSSTEIPSITVDAQGRITAASISTINTDLVSVDVHNQTGSQLDKGKPVYVAGTHSSGKPTVDLADNNGTNTYPAIGLVEANIADGTDGKVVISGVLTNLDTSIYAAGAALYLDSTAGDLSTSRPSGTNEKVQKVGLVTRQHETAGSILVIGAGRTNDINNELVTLTGVALNASNLGTFTGTTITDNTNIKTALQELETAIETETTAVFGWDHDDDTYGLYFPGTSIRTGALSGTIDIDVQSRLRRCVINDSGVVQYYLDADDSDLKAGDWLRIVETQALNTNYTGVHSESTNSLLRVGVPAWSAGTFTRGQRVTNGGYLWECIAASTTATPAAGTVASDLTGTDGQVMVEVPAFSVRYGYLNGVHTREVRLGCSDSLIAQGFQPHPAFIKTDGTYKDAFYIGAYQVTGTSPATTVSGASNRTNMTRATQRSAAAARGTGWHILSYLELAAVQTLMVTEFRDMNTQRAIGNGSQEGGVYVVNTGLSDAAGNRSQNAYTSGGANTDYISYRGLENIYGRAWQWVDGLNVYERVVYLTNDQTAFADNTSVDYNFYAQVPTGSSSYQKELFPLADVFLPSVVTGASSTTYLADGLLTSTDWRVSCIGGASGSSTVAGAFTLAISIGSSTALSSVSSRLAYATN